MSSRRPGKARGGGSRRFFVRHEWPAARRAARRAARVAARHLPRVAVPPPARVVLEHRRDPRDRDRPHVERSTTSESSSRSRSTANVAVRTISMAIYVTVADAVLAFPLAYYMARVASPRTRNSWSSQCSRRSGRATSSRRTSGGRCSASRAIINWLLAPFGLSGPGQVVLRALARVHVPLAPVHDPADLRGARAYPELVARGVGRPRRPLAADVLEGDGAARRSRPSSPARSSRSRSRSATTSFPSLIADQQFIGTVIYNDRGTQPPGRGGVRDGPGRGDDRLPLVRQATRRVREPLRR